MTPEFKKQLAALINCNSLENESNTPDFILADFMVDCLWAFNKAVRRREEWYGREVWGEKDIELDDGSGSGDTVHAPPGADEVPPSEGDEV